MKTEISKGSQVTSYKSQVKGQKFLAFIMFVGFAVWGAPPVFAGDLDSSAAPTDDTTRMYTLEQIYDVVSGIWTEPEPSWPTRQSGGFNEPSTGPGSTMHTLDNIKDMIAAGAAGETKAAEGDVLLGKKFITRIAGSGETLRTGTAASATGFYGLPKTGQETSYETLPDDADYAEPGPTKPDIGYPRGASSWADYKDNKRFTPETISGNVVITDNATGLMWEQKTAANKADTYNWENAKNYCENQIGTSGTYAGDSDWRLPNIKELVSIVDYGTVDPAIDETFFPNTKSDYYWWSSTTYAGDTNLAFHVSFSTGNVSVHNKSLWSYYVRAVRGGQ